MFLSAFVWKINPFSGEIAVFQVKLAAILKMADPPIVTHTFSPNKPDFLFIDIHWPPKPLVLEKISHFGNPNIEKNENPLSTDCESGQYPPKWVKTLSSIVNVKPIDYRILSAADV